MRKSIWVLLVGITFLVGQNAWAQYPKWEGFGGFSILSAGEGDRVQIYGWQASVTENVHKNIGAVADFGGQYTTPKGANFTVKHVNYLFGPQFSVRSDRASVFTHALLGGLYVSGGGVSNNRFAIGVGGGVDVNVNDLLAIRAFQFDWLPDRFNGDWSKSVFRVGFGFVLKGGGS